MSILSDRKIKALCVCPERIFDEKKFKELGEGLQHLDNAQTQKNIGDGTWLSRFRAKMEEFTQASWRALTDEEKAAFKPMIEPFVDHQVKEELHMYERPMNNGLGGIALIPIPGTHKKVVSYGLSSYGYDLRIGNKFKIFTNINSTVIDPKNFDERNFVEFEGDVCIIPPNSFVLAYSLEKIRMPRNVTGNVLGKSTYARCGISCLATPLEAGWEGHVTLEFANTTPLPAKLYAFEGAAQIEFFEGSDACEVSYADRKGKYMDQEAAPVAPRV
jgi:dCTP deaminase